MPGGQKVGKKKRSVPELKLRLKVEGRDSPITIDISSEDDNDVVISCSSSSEDSSSDESDWQPSSSSLASAASRRVNKAKSSSRQVVKNDSLMRASTSSSNNNTHSARLVASASLRHASSSTYSRPASMPSLTVLVKVLKLHEVRDFLCVRELFSLSMTSRYIRGQLKQVPYSKCRAGQKLVPFPAFPGLLSTPADMRLDAGLFPHQLASVQAMQHAENKTTIERGGRSAQFGALRGGILGDAPGLGKTITMLALIASTAGVRLVPPPDFWNDGDLQIGWELCRTNPVYRRDVLATLKPLRSWVRENIPPKSREEKLFFKMSDYVEPPYSDNRLPTIRDFERHVHQSLRSFIPMDTMELFRQTMLEFKASLDCRRQSLLANETGRRLAWERRLIPTSATLIVVPDALFEHWYEQIVKHLNLSAFTDTANHDDESDHIVENVVYLDAIGDLADVTSGRTALQGASIKPPVLQPWDLAKYLIVITTFSRCQAEFAIEARYNRQSYSPIESDDSNMSPCPLLQMRWLRLVVDEGHELGTHEAGNGVTQFINRIAAERRWVLSGTPTTGNEDDDDFEAHALDQLQRLLFFLRHPKYGTGMIRADQDGANNNAQQAKSLWEREVKTPFLCQEEIGRQKLLNIFQEILVMHQKDDIELPKPIFKNGQVDVQIPDEVDARILQQAGDGSGMGCVHELDEYLHSSDFQSLVDQAQAKYIIQEVRKAQQERLPPEKNHRPRIGADPGIVEDIRPIKAVVYSSNNNILLSVAEFLIRHMGNESVSEMMKSFDIGTSAGELSRFRHGERECRKCPVCKRENETGARRCVHTLVEVVLEKEGSPRILVEPERIVRLLDVDPSYLRGVPQGEDPIGFRMNGGPLSDYHKNSKFWRFNDKVEVNIRSDNSVWAGREPEDYWRGVGSGACISKAEKDMFLGPDWYFGPLPVFDNGPSTVVEARLKKWQSCGKFHNPGRWYRGPQLREAPIEKMQQDVPILCLDARLSHGLDLSFVTHMFLLEAIDDAALLEQVTSRAHRLGATGPAQIVTVHSFFKLSEETQEAIDRVGADNPGEASKIAQDKESILRKICCEYCNREFSSKAVAERHEQKHCPRNPDLERDQFRLMSVYQEIRPPPALAVDELNEGSQREAPHNNYHRALNNSSNNNNNNPGDGMRNHRNEHRGNRQVSTSRSDVSAADPPVMVSPSGLRDPRQVVEAVSQMLAARRQGRELVPQQIYPPRENCVNSSTEAGKTKRKRKSENRGKRKKIHTKSSGQPSLKTEHVPPTSVDTTGLELLEVHDGRQGMVQKRKAGSSQNKVLKKKKHKNSIDNCSQCSDQFTLEDGQSITNIDATPHRNNLGAPSGEADPLEVPSANVTSEMELQRTEVMNQLRQPTSRQVRAHGVSNVPNGNENSGHMARRPSRGLVGSSSKDSANFRTGASSTEPVVAGQDPIPEEVTSANIARQHHHQQQVLPEQQLQNHIERMKLLENLVKMRREAYSELARLDGILEDDSQKQSIRDRAEMERQAEEEGLSFIKQQIRKVQQDATL